MLELAPQSDDSGCDGELQQFMSGFGNIFSESAMLGATLPCAPESGSRGAEHEGPKRPPSGSMRFFIALPGASSGSLRYFFLSDSAVTFLSDSAAMERR